jgi:hypothetical protein
MKTYISSGHYNESTQHSDRYLPVGTNHATLRQFVSIAAFAALLIVTIFVIRNSSTVEQHPGHFLARVTH